LLKALLFDQEFTAKTQRTQSFSSVFFVNLVPAHVHRSAAGRWRLQFKPSPVKPDGGELKIHFVSCPQLRVTVYSCCSGVTWQAEIG
jgi:hypothetical protein